MTEGSVPDQSTPTTKGPIQASTPAMSASSHVSLSNLISYTLVSAAAMLAFFFAFQATLFAYYPSIQTTLSSKTITLTQMQVPIGKITISLLCTLVLVFNYWSYRMILTFNHYIMSFFTSGAALERSNGLDTGVYISTLATYESYGRKHALLWTKTFFAVLSVVWLSLAVLAWV